MTSTLQAVHPVAAPILCMHRLVRLAVILGSCLTFFTCAAQGAPSISVDGGRHEMIEAAAKALRDRLVYPDVGERAAAAIETALAAGRYDAIEDPAVLASRLTIDLEMVAHDKHLYVSPPVGQPSGVVADGAPPARPLSEGGVTRADRLAGDIGYIEIFAFSPLGMFEAPLDRAMATRTA